MSKKFTSEDKKKVIEFLNYVAKYGEFTMKTQEIIEYFKLLSHMQQQIVPKMEANILEVKSIKEVKKEESQEVIEPKKKGKG